MDSGDVNGASGATAGTDRWAAAADVAAAAEAAAGAADAMHLVGATEGTSIIENLE
jgi:hypothetical protein